MDTKDDTEPNYLKEINDKLGLLLDYVEFFVNKFGDKKAMAAMLVKSQLRRSKDNG